MVYHDDGLVHKEWLSNKRRRPVLVDIKPRRPSICLGGRPKEKMFINQSHYVRDLVTEYGYLSQCTRPDITYAVGKLSQFLENPNDTHWMAFKRVLRYLKGTQDYGLLYQPDSGNIISGYVDSSWAKDDMSLSTSGYSFQCGGGLVLWRSKKLGGPSSS